jgi:hypothetical protein
MFQIYFLFDNECYSVNYVPVNSFVDNKFLLQ